jgi:hypothetical protein
MIGWTDEGFWASSISGIIDAIDGFVEFNSNKKEEDDLSDEELAELAKKYPDQPRLS